MSMTFQPVPARLEAKSVRIPFCGCQIWHGPSVPRGYGVLSVNGRQTYAHRASWEVRNGPIPKSALVLHSCDVPSCINPDHLFIGTPLDNMRDMMAKGREGFRKNRVRGPRHHLFGRSDLWAGENNPSAKLTRASAEEIRKEYAAGARQIDLAKRFGIKQAQVSRIVRGESWK